MVNVLLKLIQALNCYFTYSLHRASSILDPIDAITAWLNEAQVSRLTDTKGSQQSCDMFRIRTGDRSAYHVSFSTPLGSLKGQSYPVVTDKQ